MIDRSQTTRDLNPLFDPSTFPLGSLKDTLILAEKVAPLVKKGDRLLLFGELGSGKTTFVRYLFKALGVTATVTSPTFALRLTYDGKMGPLNHFDLYRITSESELDELGWFEALDEGITVIEWAERLSSYRPHDCLLLHFQENGSSRMCTVSGEGNWKERLLKARQDGTSTGY